MVPFCMRAIQVLLLRSADGQTYYVVERMVKVSDEPVPND